MLIALQFAIHSNTLSQSCPTHHPSIIRPLVGDEPTVWESRDIAEKHPTRPGVFRVLGRTDDQIVLSNAEKTNAFVYPCISQGSSNVGIEDLLKIQFKVMPKFGVHYFLATENLSMAC